MKINIEVLYKHPNKIVLLFDKKETELINDKKKTILASEIYKAFDYKIGKKYELKSIGTFKDINEDFQSYLTDVYEMIDSIIKDFQ